MNGAPIALVTGSRPAKRIFMDGGAMAAGSEIAATLASDNVDAGSPDRTTILRPGNVLLRDSATGKWYDDASTGDASTQASVSSAATADASWDNATITVTVNGVDIATVTLGAADDTDTEVVAALNADAKFRAKCIAAVVSAKVNIKTLDVGADVHLLVVSSYATAFGASGTAARGTDGDWAVLTDYVDMLNGVQVAAVQHGVTLVRNGFFDDDNLVWAGAAGLATLHQDAVRVLRKRGCKFKTLER